MLSNTYDSDGNYQWADEDATLAATALTVALSYIQDRLGVQSGDSAALFLAEQPLAEMEQDAERLLTAFVRNERERGSTVCDVVEPGDRVITTDSLPIADDFDGLPEGSVGTVVANDENGLRVLIDGEPECLREWGYCLEACGEECRYVLAALRRTS